MIGDILADTSMDCLKMLPYLFVAFLLIEALEKYSKAFPEKILLRVGKAGPVAGALLGCIPQCGFSIMAANFYAGGIISVGTLLSVFIATSDEAILIMLGNPDGLRIIAPLLAAKVLIAVVAGYLTDWFLAERISLPKESGKLPKVWQEHNEEKGIVSSACGHTAKLFLYLFGFTGILNLCVEVFGIERLSAFLLGDSMLQPVFAAFVLLTQLYLGGAISYASVIAGLCTGAGVGLAVLCKVNQDRWENVRVIGILFAIAVAAGLFLELLM